MRHPYLDIRYLAERNQGKIPDQIPAHYVRWCQGQFRFKPSNIKTVPMVIRL